MSAEYRCDIGVKVTADSPEQAAEICAAVLAIGTQITGQFVPCFVGVRPSDAKPDIQQQLAQDAATQAQALQAARNVFDGIMGDSAV